MCQIPRHAVLALRGRDLCQVHSLHLHQARGGAKKCVTQYKDGQEYTVKYKKMLLKCKEVTKNNCFDD